MRGLKLIGLAIIPLALLLVLPKACVKPEQTTRQLEQMGYKQVEITGFDFFACAKDDSFQTGFEATAPNGDRVTGVHCAGFMKAGTIRFY